MKFLVDESADARLAAHLKRLGHDATAIGLDYVASLKDPEVLAIAHREQRTLITNDHAFGELVFRDRQPHAGVILLRLGTTSLAPKIERLNYALEHFADRLDQFLVVTERSMRARSSGKR